MRIASTQSSLTRQYSVSVAVPDAAPSPADVPDWASLMIGKAITSAARQGDSIVIATPKTAADLPTSDHMQLAKAIGAVVGETLGGSTIAKSAWNLSTLSVTTTQPELVKILIEKNISPEHAASYAKDILKTLGDPLSKGILIAISASAATYVVVQRTGLSALKRWSIVGAVGVSAFGLYFLARHVGIMV